MSWQALNWASAQYIPNRSKLLLIVLANHAATESWHCFPSVEFLMKETSYSRASVYAFLAALRRNGYITVKRPKHDGAAPDIWLNPDREDRPWTNQKAAEGNNILHETDETAGDDDPLDVVGSPTIGQVADATSPTIGLVPSQESKDWTRGGPHSISEPSLSEPTREATAPPAPPPLALGHSAKRRRAEIHQKEATEQANKKTKVFVFEGTRAWSAWNQQRSYPITTAIIDGHSRRGWWFPTLFPPSSDFP